MPRLRLARIVTWHLELACGHHLRYTTAGYYPAAVACPTCRADVVWVTDMWITKDQVQSVADHRVAPPTFQPTSPRRPPVAAGPRLYTVVAATEVRHSGEPPHRYVLWAATWAEAVTRAARQCLADHDQPDRALIATGGDGLPVIHIAALHTGMPLHPGGTPGQEWTDLRGQTEQATAQHMAGTTVLVLAADRTDSYTRLATAYHTERDTAETRAALAQNTCGQQDEPVAESAWYDTSAAADDLAASVAHLFAGTLPTLDLHDTGNGERCAFSHARLDLDLPGSGPVCPSGCPHATVHR